ncbi:hypothetical protein Lesp02_54030 [Lentzea sp. NBRC 105346]|nr:hypothetical protein Lesp02_54030 [Lentzea sp. NBRC 105346]
MVLEHRRPARDEPLDLLIARHVRRLQADVQPVLDRLLLGHLDEQVLDAVRQEDEALGVAGVVVRVHGQAEHLAPPLGLLVGVRAVNGDVVNLGGHGLIFG